MTDSLKLAEMQRTSIEFERQRHLANWFIKSSPHMANPHQSQTPNNGSNNINASNNSNNSKTQKLLFINNSLNKINNNNINNNGTKNGTITTANPLFLLMSSAGQAKQQQSSTPPLQLAVAGGGPPPPPPIHHPFHHPPPVVVPHHPHPHHLHQLGGNNLALSRSQLFTSQTNLPLQIAPSSSAQEGHKPKLRRYNSHDTSANMFSVAEFENARLARRNEIELKQRQQQRLKINSLSSGGDCSTGDSKGSKYSNDSQPEPLTADLFLERYPLPRIVRISYKTKFSNETLQSSSSNGSSSSNSSSLLVNKNGNNDLLKQNGGELFLLYRHLQQRKIYHGFNTKTGVNHRKKGVMIPQEFPGYFSLVSEKGTPTATMYTTLTQLVRECVHKFISVDNLPAFTESQKQKSSTLTSSSAAATTATQGITTTNSSETFQTRPHYVKITARGGQVFRLLAVFEDGKHDGNNSSSNKNNNNSLSGREKDKGRYAQLLNENRQILYVNLTTKGKFYEIEPSVPQILQKTGMIHNDTKKKINPDCVHRISNLITPDKELPISLKFISGGSGGSGQQQQNINHIPEFLTITKISTENILIACPIDDIETQSPLQLKKLNVTPQMTLIKCFLGFENEQRMLANQNVQNILKYCQFNCDHFLKMIELEIFSRPERSTSKGRVESLKILKPLNFPKLLRREKSATAHEKEDSIIFLSKNDLANLESSSKERDTNTINTDISKTNSINNGNSSQNRITDKMKVFQSTKKKWFKKNDKHNSLTNLEIDAQAKRMSMERYNDMSKLLQERFGDTNGLADINERPTSEIGNSTNENKKRTSMLHQLQKSLSLQDVDFLDKPDLLPPNFAEQSINGSENNINFIDEKHKNQQQKQEILKSKQYKNFAINSFNNQQKSNLSGIQQEEQENQNQQQHQNQQSFISQKMYSEFHVKTRQYSKSSSSLHQLLHFAVPQRMNVVETKKQSAAAKKVTTENSTKGDNKKEKTFSKNLELSFSNIPFEDDIYYTSTSNPTSPTATSTTTTTIIDDLPYSSVRDSLLTNDQSSNDDTATDISKTGTQLTFADDTMENIYAEICHNNNNNITNINNSLIHNSCAFNINSNNKQESGINKTNLEEGAVSVISPGGVAISRVQINMESYPPVMTLFDQQHQKQLKEHQQQSQNHGASNDNIYNTLK